MDPLLALTAGVTSLSLSSNKAPHAVMPAQEKSHVAISLYMLQRMQQAGLLKERYVVNEAQLGTIPPPTNESRQRFKLQQACELQCQFFEGATGESYTLYVPFLNLMQRMKEARECGFSPIKEVYIPGSGASRIAGPTWYRTDLQTICKHELSDLVPLAGELDLSHIEDADDLDTHFNAEGAQPCAKSVHYFNIHPEALFIVELIEQHYRQLLFTIEYENGKCFQEQGFYQFLRCMSKRQMRQGTKSVKIESPNIPWMRKITLSMQEVKQIWQKLEASGFFYLLKNQNWGAVEEIVLNLALDYIFKMNFESVVHFFHEKAKAFPHYHALYRECQKGVLRDWNRFTCKDTSGTLQDVLFMRTTTTPKKRIAFQEMQIDMMPSLCGRTHELTIKTSWQAIIDKIFRLIRWLDFTFADQKDWALFWFLISKRYVSVLPDTQAILQARFLDFCKQKGDNAAAFCKAILEKLDGRSKQDKTLNFVFIFNSLSALPESEFSNLTIATIWESLQAVYYDASLDPSWKLIADALLDHSVDYKSLTTLLKKLAYDLLSQPADTPQRVRFKAFITEHNCKMVVQFEMAGFTFLFPHDIVNDLNAFENCKDNLRLQLIARRLYPESTSVQSLFLLVPECPQSKATDALLVSEIEELALSKKDAESLTLSLHNPQSFTENLLSISDEKLNSVGLALWKKLPIQDAFSLISRLAKVRVHSAQLIVRTLAKEDQKKQLPLLFEEAIKEKNQGKFLQLIYSLCDLCEDEKIPCSAALTLFQQREDEKAVSILSIASERKCDSLLARFSREYRDGNMSPETVVALACRQEAIYNQLFFLAAIAMQKANQKIVDECALFFVARSGSLQFAKAALQELVARKLTSSAMIVWMNYVELQEGKAAFDAYQAGFDLHDWSHLVASQYPLFYGTLITKLYRSNDPSLFLEAAKLETRANGYVIGYVDPKAKVDAKKHYLECRIQIANEETLPELLAEALGQIEQEKIRSLFAKWLCKKNLVACLEVLQKTGSRDFTLWSQAFEKATKEANAKQKKRAIELAKEAVVDTATITTHQEAIVWCEFEGYYLQLKNPPIDPTLEAMQNGEHALCTKFAGDDFRQMRLHRYLLRVVQSATTPTAQMRAARDSLDSFLQPRKIDRTKLDLAYIKLMLESNEAECFLSAALRLEALTKEEITIEHGELISRIAVRAYLFAWPGREALHECLIALFKHYQTHLMQLLDPFYLILGLASLPPKLYFKIAAEIALCRIKGEGALRDVQGVEEAQPIKSFVLRLIETFDPQLIELAASIIDSFPAIHDLKKDIAVARQLMRYVASPHFQKAAQRTFDLLHNLFQTNYSRDPNVKVNVDQDHQHWVEKRVVTTPLETLSMSKIISQAVTGYMGYLTYTYNLVTHYPTSIVETRLSEVFNEELAKDELLIFTPQQDFCAIGKNLLLLPTHDMIKKVLLSSVFSMLQQAMRYPRIPKKEVVSFLEAFILSKNIPAAASLFHHRLCQLLLNTAEAIHFFKDYPAEQKLFLTATVMAKVPTIRGISDEKRKESITRAISHLFKRADMFSEQKAFLLLAAAIESKIAFEDEQLLRWALTFAATLKNRVSFHEQEIDCLLKCIACCKEMMKKETALAKEAKAEILAILQRAYLLETPFQTELKQQYATLSGA